MDDEDGDLQAIEHEYSRLLSKVRAERAFRRKKRVEMGAEQRMVTDHALIRYLERHKGLNVEAVRDEMRALADNSTPAKDGEHHWSEAGIIMVLGASGQIITVLSTEQATTWFGRKLRNGTRVTCLRRQNL